MVGRVNEVVDDVAALEVVNTYLRAFYTGDFDDARAVVDPCFSFEGPFVRVDAREDFFRSAEGLRSVVGGHRLLRQWVDDDEVASFYTVTLRTPAGEGEVLMSEWHTVRDGLLVRGRVTFDTAEFRSLLPTAEEAKEPRGSRPRRQSVRADPAEYS